MNKVSVTQELIPVQKINVPKLFTNRRVTEAMLAAIKKKAKALEPDLSTATSRKEIASNAYKVAQSKTFLDGIGKDYVAHLKEEAKVTDDLRKLIRDNLDALRDEVRKPLSDWEAAEKERADREFAEHKFGIDWDDAHAEHDLWLKAKELDALKAEMARKEAEQKAKEDAERIAKEHAEAQAKAIKEAAERATREAEQAAENARIAAAAKAQAEIEAAQRKEREAKEAAEQAERDRIAAIEKAKADQESAVKAAEKRAKEESERKERERLAAESKAKAEADKLAANKAHQKKINNEALDSFKANGIDSDTAKKIIGLIAEGLISHIKIAY